MPPKRAYHHGDLRDALLAAAEATVARDGVDALSMRGLARAVGVSHAAPQAHFADRDALLDALAGRGFGRLETMLAAAPTSGDEPFDERFAAVMERYVAFASEHAALMEVMFARKPQGPEGRALRQDADRALGAMTDLIDEGVRTGALTPLAPERYWLLLAALTRGIAGLMISGRIADDAVPTLVADATATFLRGNRP